MNVVILVLFDLMYVFLFIFTTIIVMEILWTISIYLESVCIIPQLYMMEEYGKASWGSAYLPNLAGIIQIFVHLKLDI